MKAVTIERKELLEKLKLNKEEHIEDVLEGLKKRKQQVDIFLKCLIDENKHSDGNLTVDINSKYPLIVSHEESYDRVIAMLEMSVDDNITLTSQEFDQYVLDNWSFSFSLRSSLGAAGLDKYKG